MAGDLTRPAGQPQARARCDSEELLQLHRSAHVPFDLELPGHVGAGCVLLAAGDLLERLLGGRDRDVAVVRAFGHLDAAVLYVDLPLAGAVDVEHVRVVHACGLGRIHAALETFEELPGAHGENPTSAGSSRSRLRAGGSMNASALATSGAAAATNNAVRRLVASATPPSASAATPPSPTDRPITSPEAVPTCRGMYSWPMTIVTPNVPTTQVPTSASAIVPGTPPTRMKTSASGPVAMTLASRTVRAPKRSASGPRASVPTPPANSIRASRWLPCAFECPSDTSQRGTNVISPNHATLRRAITPSSSFIACGSSRPVDARAAPLAGANPRRYDAPTRSASATARPGI